MRRFRAALAIALPGWLHGASPASPPDRTLPGIAASDLKSTFRFFRAEPAGEAAKPVEAKSAGQSFLATVPYLSAATLRTGDTAGAVRFRIYAFDPVSPPLGKTPRSLAECLCRIGGDGAAACRDWLVPDGREPGPLYLKPGTLYYLEAAAAPPGKALRVGVSHSQAQGIGADGAAAPQARAYLDGRPVPGEKGRWADLALTLEGGFPAGPGRPLPVLADSGLSGPWARAGDTLFQTFTASVPFIRSAGVMSLDGSGRLRLAIREADPATGVTWPQAGGACEVRAQAGALVCDWQESGLPVPALRVGGRYRLEVARMGGGGAPALAPGLRLTGFDPMADGEPVFRARSTGKAAWKTAATSAGQSFIATTPFLISAATDFGPPGTAIFRLYRFSGDSSRPRGESLGAACSTQVAADGNAFCFWKEPIPTSLGKAHYLEVTRSGGGRFQASGGIRAGPNPGEAYLDGKRYSPEGASACLNLRLRGLMTGASYLGFGNGLNAPNLRSALSRWEWVERTGSTWVREQFIREDFTADPGAFERLSQRVDGEGRGGVIGIIKSNIRKLEGDGTKEFLTGNYVADLSDFAGLLAERFRGRHIVWEILNEPEALFVHDPLRKAADTPASYGSEDRLENKPGEYAKIVAACAAKMRAKDPGVIVAAGVVSSLAGRYPEEQIALGIGDAIDFYSFHPYGESTPEKRLEGWALRMRVLFSLRAETTGIRRRPQLLASEYGVQVGGRNYMHDAWREDGVPRLSAPCTRFGQVFRAGTEGTRLLTLKTGPGTESLSARFYEYSGDPGRPKGRPLGGKAIPSASGKEGLAEFRLDDGSAVDFERDRHYYVEFTRSGSARGPRPTYLSPKAGPNADGNAYLDGTKAEVDGAGADLTLRMDNAYLYNQNSTTWTETEAAVYHLRFFLSQLENNVACAVHYKLSEDRVNGDSRSFYREMPEGELKPAGTAIRNAARLLFFALGEPPFAVRFPEGCEGVARVDDVNGKLWLAVWRAGSAAFDRKRPGTISIMGDAYGPQVRAHADLHRKEPRSWTLRAKEGKGGGLSLDAFPIGESPILLEFSLK
ncbi:MAG TPA: hypothetical protein VJ385_20865 [Fibrobacteria bacterium]|nr:hypothetical protein [Fibrobacteria bacterium]